MGSKSIWCRILCCYRFYSYRFTKVIDAMYYKQLERGLGAEFVVPFSSGSVLLLIIKWHLFHSKWELRSKWRRFSENFIILNKKSCYLMTFWWQLERKRTRARGKRKNKFSALEKFPMGGAPACICESIWPCKLEGCWVAQELQFLCQSISCTVHSTWYL